jgi:hypothetical protein
VGAFFTDGVPVPAAENEVRVTVSASGLNSVSSGEQTVPGPGPATAMVTPFTGGGGVAGSTAVTLAIRTAWKGLFNGESRSVVACVGPAALPARAPAPARRSAPAAGPVAQEEQCAGLAVTPASVTVAPGATVQFTASLVGGEPLTDVTWTVSGGGTITPTGLFTSSGTLGTFVVRAESVADPTSFGIAQVTVAADLVVLPGEVRVAPGSGVQFAALLGGTPVTTVIWEVSEGGTITPSGAFTAGQGLGVFSVLAIDPASGSSGSATVIVSNGPLVVSTECRFDRFSFRTQNNVPGLVSFNFEFTDNRVEIASGVNGFDVAIRDLDILTGQPIPNGVSATVTARIFKFGSATPIRTVGITVTKGAPASGPCGEILLTLP